MFAVLSRTPISGAYRNSIRCRGVSGAGTSSSEKLRLVFGAASVPKAPGTFGEDAYFADHGTSTFGIADGAGSWAAEGVDAGLFSRGLLSHTQNELSRRARSLLRPDLVGALRVAFEATMGEKVRGSCTIVLGQLHGDTLSMLHLGDSGIIVMRPMQQISQFLGGEVQMMMRPVYRTSPILHKANMPWQLSSEDEEGSDFKGLDLISARLRVGDIVIAGCDGLFDNVTEDDLIALALEHREGKAARESDAVTSFAQRVVNLAADVARSPEGKIDDITVIVAEAVKWTASPTGGLLDNLKESGPGALDASVGVASSDSDSRCSSRSVVDGCTQPPGQRSHNAGFASLHAAVSVRSAASATNAPTNVLVQEGTIVKYIKLGEPAAHVEACVGRMLGKGSYATAWELSSGDGSVAVLKCFHPPEPLLACLFGEAFRREVEEQFVRERRVGERLHMGPNHPGRSHITHMLSSIVTIAGPIATLSPQPQMLVHEYAGDVLEGQVASNLSLEERLRLVDNLLLAVSYLRLLGVVHADISAGNCCLDASGHVRLMDFGSAVLFDHAPSRTTPGSRLEQLRARYVHNPRFPPAERYAHPLTVKQLIVDIENPRGLDVYRERYDPDLFPGNIAATPPEALRGILVPGFSDVYGLGVLLWQLLTEEETPFEVDVECERVHFSGWSQFYRLQEIERLNTLREHLDKELLPVLRSGFANAGPIQDISNWLVGALAEAPEDRAQVATAGVLSAYCAAVQ